MTATRTSKKKNRFYEQNKSSARASRFLVHFFDVYCTPTTRFIQDVDIRPWFFLSVFERNLDKVLKNSTPGKITYIWQIERVQIRRDQVWKNANSLFWRRFHCRRRCHDSVFNDNVPKTIVWSAKQQLCTCSTYTYARSPKIQISGKFTYIWGVKWVRITITKFEVSAVFFI